MRTMGARLLSFLSCRAYGKFGMTAVMRRAEAVRPVNAQWVSPYVLMRRGRKVVLAHVHAWIMIRSSIKPSLMSPGAVD